MRALAWLKNKEAAEPISAQEMLSLRRKRTGVLWADYPAPTEADFAFLIDNFGFDRRTILECRHDHQHRAKIGDHGDYLFVVWPVLSDDPGTLDIESDVVFFFVGPNYVITIHDRPLPLLDDVSRRTIDDTEVAINGSDWLLLRILDDAVDTYLPAIDRLTDVLDDLEDTMFEQPTQQNITDLFKIKHAMLTLRRMAAPERDVVNSLARHDSKLIDRGTFVYFQDIYDHLARITDAIDMARDVVGGAMDIYLSSISNRMNDIMKRLTVVATIFLPITFITSLFGMNVGFPLRDTALGFWLIVVLMVVIAVGMLVDFRRRGWW